MCDEWILSIAMHIIEMLIKICGVACVLINIG